MITAGRSTQTVPIVVIDHIAAGIVCGNALAIAPGASLVATWGIIAPGIVPALCALPPLIGASLLAIVLTIIPAVFTPFPAIFSPFAPVLAQFLTVVTTILAAILSLFLAVMAVNLIGDRLTQALDPSLARRG